MAVEILQETLKSVLGQLSGAISSRSTLPVLANVLIKVEGGKVTMAATDLEKMLVTTVGAKAPFDETWSITVPAKTFSDLVATMPADTVRLTHEAATVQLKVECGRTRATIKCIPGEEFPTLPDTSGGWRVALSDAAAFKTAVARCVFAAANDDTRPTLSGVLFRFNENGTLDLAATDGFRLSLATLPLGITPVSKEFIVPAKSLVFLLRLLGEQVTIVAPSEHGRVLFLGDGWTMLSQLISGQYPDYAPIIPKKYNVRSVVSVADMNRAVRTAHVFAKSASETVRVRCYPATEPDLATMELSAESAEIGDNVSRVDADHEGSEITVAFSAAYLRDALGALGTAQAALQLTSPMEPGMLLPVGDDTFRHIIMPMHFGR